MRSLSNKTILFYDLQPRLLGSSKLTLLMRMLASQRGDLAGGNRPEAAVRARPLGAVPAEPWKGANRPEAVVG
jgi:hypothetical protein